MPFLVVVPTLAWTPLWWRAHLLLFLRPCAPVPQTQLYILCVFPMLFPRSWVCPPSPLCTPVLPPPPPPPPIPLSPEPTCLASPAGAHRVPAGLPPGRHHASVCLTHASPPGYSPCSLPRALSCSFVIHCLCAGVRSGEVGLWCDPFLRDSRRLGPWKEKKTHLREGFFHFHLRLKLKLCKESQNSD